MYLFTDFALALKIEVFTMGIYNLFVNPVATAAKDGKPKDLVLVVNLCFLYFLFSDIFKRY